MTVHFDKLSGLYCKFMFPYNLIEIYITGQSTTDFQKIDYFADNFIDKTADKFAIIKIVKFNIHG